jgi:hypothetical protein
MRVMNKVGHIEYECEFPKCGLLFETADEQLHHKIHDHYTAIKGMGCRVCDKK